MKYKGGSLGTYILGKVWGWGWGMQISPKQRCFRSWPLSGEGVNGPKVNGQCSLKKTEIVYQRPLIHSFLYKKSRVYDYQKVKKVKNVPYYDNSGLASVFPCDRSVNFDFFFVQYHSLVWYVTSAKKQVANFLGHFSYFLATFLIF